MPAARLILSALTPAAATSARREFGAWLQAAGWSNDDDAMLVFSELVANAVLHAGGATRIGALSFDSSLRIEVDDNTRVEPSRRPSGSSQGGFGLGIVNQLADAWGWTPTATGKSVWCSLPGRFTSR